MTDAEKREAARQFYQKWAGKGKEDEDDRSYWVDLLVRLYSVTDVTDRIEFQKKVKVNGNTKRIDAYIPETKVLIEQKSIGIDLSKPQSGHDGKTPYEQAKEYDNHLPSSEKSRWIILSNFAEIWIYDMDTKEPEKNILKIQLEELVNKHSLLDFLISREVKKINKEVELSKEAGLLVGKIHDRFQEQYNDPMAKRTQNSLNILCVRLVFCLYAEDAGLFGDKDAFSRYIAQYDPKDIRYALQELFRALNTPLDKRAEEYFSDEVEAFPYVNGGLFEREHIEIPKITQEIKDILIESSGFDWSEISPTIFGAVFESTLNPETRRSGGMHYTSIENIHKVIDPLFLDDLKDELEQIRAIKVERTRDRQLCAFQDKLASMKWFDPACGSGNFLTETYMSIRRLENEVLGDLQHGQIMFGFEAANPIKVGINQFYGIEINDFAVTVAKTALWIAESQMMKETEDVVHMNLDFLPLKTNAYIVEGNALQLDWNKIVNRNELTYMIGNPPFVGTNYLSDLQRKDMDTIWGDKRGKADYVTCWYIKAADYIKEAKHIQCAFVSTNSICQGEQACSLWEIMLKQKGVIINFAVRTFVWDNESNDKAKVHVVIIGFSKTERQIKRIYDGESVVVATNINGYLLDAPTVIIKEQTKPLCGVTAITRGSQATDDGLYLFTKEEKEAFVKLDPGSDKYFRRFMMGREFINNIERWCLWMPDITPGELKQHTHIKDRVSKVRDFRLASKNKQTKAAADVPWRFGQYRKPSEHYIAFAKVSSERRRYVPFGFLDDTVIPGDKLFTIPDATIYDFGILTSNVHMSWMRMVCGRMKSDYSYSTTIVYNTFPWPCPTEAQKAKIEQTAQGILDARALYPDSSLADLYDPLTMPPELRKAHQLNDKAVMQAYGFDIKNTSEADCVAHLMKMYQELTC